MTRQAEAFLIIIGLLGGEAERHEVEQIYVAAGVDAMNDEAYTAWRVTLRPFIAVQVARRDAFLKMTEGL